MPATDHRHGCGLRMRARRADLSGVARRLQPSATGSRRRATLRGYENRPRALALWPGQVHTSESGPQGMWSDSDNAVEQQDAADEVRASSSRARPSPLILVFGGRGDREGAL